MLLFLYLCFVKHRVGRLLTEVSVFTGQVVCKCYLWGQKRKEFHRKVNQYHYIWSLLLQYTGICYVNETVHHHQVMPSNNNEMRATWEYCQIIFKPSLGEIWDLKFMQVLLVLIERFKGKNKNISLWCFGILKSCPHYWIDLQPNIHKKSEEIRIKPLHLTTDHKRNRIYDIYIYDVNNTMIRKKRKHAENRSKIRLD